MSDTIKFPLAALEQLCNEIDTSASEEIDRLTRERDEARELVKAYQEYTKLLGDEINSMATVAHVHGWESTRVEQGKFLREKIKQMEESK